MKTEYMIALLGILTLADLLALKIMHRRDMAKYGIFAKWYL